MMSKAKTPVLRQRIFEARYQGGYQYLDRCGALMLLLEESLAELTNSQWMPVKMTPSGAQLKCPDHEAIVALDSSRLIVDQSFHGGLKSELDFPSVAEETLALVKGRLDVRTMVRYGGRRWHLLPSDCFDEANELSVKHYHSSDWWHVAGVNLPLVACQEVLAFEEPDHSRGIRLETSPLAEIAADVTVDERLQQPAHQLPKGQREALIEQLKRAKRRQENPDAGLLLDCDYWESWPLHTRSIREFLTTSWEESDRLEEAFLDQRRSQ